MFLSRGLMKTDLEEARNRTLLLLQRYRTPCAGGIPKTRKLASTYVCRLSGNQGAECACIHVCLYAVREGWAPAHRRPIIPLLKKRHLTGGTPGRSIGGARSHRQEGRVKRRGRVIRREGRDQEERRVSRRDLTNRRDG